MRGWLKDVRIPVAGGIILLILLVSLVGPVLAPHDPSEMSARHRLQGPQSGFWLGTDDFGRDLLSRLLYGTRLTMLVAFGGIALGMVVGVALGTVAGYYGGWTDILVMRLVDAILCFPPMLLAIFVVCFLGRSVGNLVLVVGVLYVPRFSRVAYGSAVALRETDFVEASRAIGYSDVRILLRSILPNSLAPIFVQFSLGLGHAILLESGLSFLGLGPPPPAPSWGRMIEQCSRFMHISAYPIIWPSVAICLSVLAFNVFGDALRDRLDPRLKDR